MTKNARMQQMIRKVMEACYMKFLVGRTAISYTYIYSSETIIDHYGNDKVEQATNKKRIP